LAKKVKLKVAEKGFPMHNMSIRLLGDYIWASRPCFSELAPGDCGVKKIPDAGFIEEPLACKI
jgi:hypothetical protein